MKKRLFSFLLAIVMVSTLFPLSGCGGSTAAVQPSQDAAQSTLEYMTRGEWITLLGQTFGLDSYQEKTAYYSDVTENSDCFAYVQSCREWNILPGDSAFRPDETVDRAFVAETAVLASGLDYSAADGSAQAEKTLNFAAAQGIVADADGTGKVTASEGQIAADTAKRLYLDKDFPQYDNSVLNSNVVNLSDLSSDQITYTDTAVTMSAALAEGLATGSVFIVPGNSENPYGIAKKVMSVQKNGDQVIIRTEQPKLEEVFDKLDFSYVGAPEIEDVEPAQDGITVVPYSSISGLAAEGKGNARISLLVNSGEGNGGGSTAADASDTKGLSFGLKINLTKGQLTPNVNFTDWFSQECTQSYDKFFGNNIGENAGNLLKQTHTVIKSDENGNQISQIDDEYTAGLEIEGSLAVKNLYLESACETEKLVGIPCGIKSYTSQLHYKIEGKLSVKGKLGVEEMIYSTVIPGPWGIWNQVKFYVCIDFNGEVSIKATLEHTSNVTYADGNYRKTSDTDIAREFEISAELWSGVKGEIVLKVLGIPIVDAEAKAGAGMEVKSTLHMQSAVLPADSTLPKSMICFDFSVYVPTVKITVGMDSETLANKLKIKATFKIMDKKGKHALIDSPEKTLFHYEISAKGMEIVPECTWKDYVADASASSDTSASPGDNPFSALVLQDAILTMGPGESKQIVITAYPDNVTGADIQFSSLDTSIATVDSSGRVTGVTPGTTQIRVSALDGSEQYCAVTVTGSGNADDSLSFL